MKLTFISLVILYTGFANFIHAKESRFQVNRSLNTKIILQDTIKSPIMAFEKTVLKPMTIVYISDTVNMTEITNVFKSAYAELFSFIPKNGLVPGKVMAFYYNYNDPIALEAAIEVNKIPGTLSGRIKSRKVEGGDVVIVHYTGPYEEMDTPYNALSKWLKDNNNQAIGLPFEVYLNEPSMVKDKYELKTDIYQLIK